MDKATSKAEAAGILIDELEDLQLHLDRAETILQDITEDYFNKIDLRHNPENINMIVSYYDDYTIRSNIVTDYLIKLRLALDALVRDGRKVHGIK